MITFVDLGPIAHVHLFLRVSRPLPAGGWSWGELPGYPGILAQEYAYNAGECRALVQTYGRTVARVIASHQLGARFRIYARGRSTGMVLGIREWEWCPVRREYVPMGEYMCGWREAIRDYYVKTGELFHTKRFSARVGPVKVVPDLVPLPSPPVVTEAA